MSQATMREPRIAPVPADERDSSTEEYLQMLQDSGVQAMNLSTTFAHNPGLLRRWWPFGAKLLAGGKLPVRDREVLILRTAWNCRCDYEWGQHLRTATDAGLLSGQIAALCRDVPIEAGWSPLDAALLNAADELHRDAVISEATWEVLQAAYTPAQLIELCILVGQYHMVAYFVRSAGVARDAGIPGFPD